MVWEDNAIDGEGKGIALGSLDEALHLEGDPILVNQTSEGIKPSRKLQQTLMESV